MTRTRDSFLSQLIDFEREISQSRQLSLFRRNPSTWELLLYLAQFPEDASEGLYDTVESLQTRYLGSSAMLKFVRERREDGLLLFTEHAKRSKWMVGLHPELRTELLELLHRRIAQLHEAASAAAPAKLHQPYRDGPGKAQMPG